MGQLAALVLKYINMIKFFRKIRYDLMNQNKTGKPAFAAGRYFKYAIGEIVLVVIGILIALQINNWNEEKKAKQFEYKVLNDIKGSMQTNYRQLKMSINNSNNYIKSADIILSHLEKNLPYHDSLDTHFSNAISYFAPTIRNAGYESLKTYGLNTITNDSIKEALDIYDNEWMQTLGIRQEEYFFNSVSPILTELFETVSSSSKMKPFNYDELQNSKRYLSIINTSKAYRKEQIYWHEKWINNIKEIEIMIDDELKKQ